MALLWPGLSLLICSMSRPAPAQPAGHPASARPRLVGSACWGPRCPGGPAHYHAPLVSWAPCVSLSPCPRVSCECVSQSSGACESPSPSPPGPAAVPLPGRRAPTLSRDSSVCLSACAGSKNHATALSRLPLAHSLVRCLAGSVARSLALPLRSGSAEGGGVGVQGGGRGGSCILAVGEESEPALLVSRRAQLQPRGPARPLAARPGLPGWARARPGAGGGAGHCSYPGL
jgi:hypothetical protein